MNDVALAVLSGGLGRYLRDHGMETDGLELKTLCPVNMRRVDQRGGGDERAGKNDDLTQTHDHMSCSTRSSSPRKPR